MYAGVSHMRSHAHAHDHRKPPEGEYANRVNRGEEAPASFAVGKRVECNLGKLQSGNIGGHHVDVSTEFENDEYKGVWAGATITQRYWHVLPAGSRMFDRRHWRAYKVELDSPLVGEGARGGDLRFVRVYEHDANLVRGVNVL